MLTSEMSLVNVWKMGWANAIVVEDAAVGWYGRSGVAVGTVVAGYDPVFILWEEWPVAVLGFVEGMWGVLGRVARVLVGLGNRALLVGYF